MPGPRQQSPSPLNDRGIHHLSIHAKGAALRLRAGEHPLRPLKLLDARRKRPMDRCQLTRVNTEHAAKAHLARAQRCCMQGLVIVELRRAPGQGGGQPGQP